MQVLLLDIGGIVLEVDWSHSIKIMEEIQGRPMPANLIETVSSWPSMHQLERGEIAPEDFSKQLIKFLNLKMDTDSFVKAWNACLVRVIPGVEELLEKVTIPIFALSNTNQIHYDCFKSLSVFKPFKKIFASHEFGARKPEESFYTDAIAEIGVPADQILFIDDLEENLAVARRLGINAEQSLNSGKRMQEILAKYKVI